MRREDRPLPMAEVSSAVGCDVYELGRMILCVVDFLDLSPDFPECLSFSTGNLSSLVVLAAALGALGYGYMWWKGISFSDLMYVTKWNMEKTVTDLTKKLQHASDVIAAAGATETFREVP